MDKTELQQEIIKKIVKILIEIVGQIYPYLGSDWVRINLNELSSLKAQLKELPEVPSDDYCTCGNPSEEGNVKMIEDEILVYFCADCGKRVEDIDKTREEK